VQTLFPPDPTYGNQEGLLYQTKSTYFEGTTQKIVINNQWFDGAGRPVRSGQATTSAQTSFDVVKTSYDSKGRVRKATNPYNTTNSDGDTTGLPNATRYDYDALDRVITLTHPDSQTVQTSYNGAMVTVTDEVGRQRQSTMDGFGRLASIAEQNDASTGS